MWHEAQRSEKKAHDMMDAAQKRAQRRAVYLAKRRGGSSAVHLAPRISLPHVPRRRPLPRHRRSARPVRFFSPHLERIPWNGKEDILIDSYIASAPASRDLLQAKVCLPTITDEEGLQHVNQEIEAKVASPFGSDRSLPAQAPASNRIHWWVSLMKGMEKRKLIIPMAMAMRIRILTVMIAIMKRWRKLQKNLV